MAEVTLGKTSITVSRNGSGALPTQKMPVEDTVYLAKEACEGDITFFDTTRNYTDSEEKLGAALEEIRDKVFIATKTAARTAEKFRESLKISPKNLRTNYVGLYQFHNPSLHPKPGDSTGPYEAVLEAKEQGRVRHMGITNHRLSVAMEATDSDIYETLQFPFCYLATSKDLELVKQCREADMGFIVMKALSGGLTNNSQAAYAYLAQFDNVFPIWGVQKERELDELLSYVGNPPKMTDEIRVLIDEDRRELLGEFYRGRGYYTPYPVGIEIDNRARMSFVIRGVPSTVWPMPDTQGKMKRIEQCFHCNQYKGKCLCSLNAPLPLEKNLEDYLEILNGKEY